ncbi:MAG: GntR family transcriptional regulator [Candidatus Ornithospirochaeta sp.]
MTLFISNSSDDAIYLQIENQIKDQILKGELIPGTPLPSMRILAKDLRVSVITVQKAYENLSREGFITSGVGRGTFVSDIKSSVLKEKNFSLVEEAVIDAARKARRGGIDKEEVIALFEKHFNNEVGNDDSGNKESK